MHTIANTYIGITISKRKQMSDTELKLLISHTANANMDDIKKEEFCNHSMDLDQKHFLSWSPQEDNRCLSKHQYVSCSRSFPRRNKRFVRYRISRSLNFDGNHHDSSLDNSSFEADKYLSRSAKIMRALNFNSNPAYYGKTKIKRSLNFNSTPSPKSFARTKKNIQRSASLNFNSPTAGSHKILTFDESPNHSANSSLIFASPESIDENQNKTPSRQTAKSHKSLNYSTPNTIGRKSIGSATFSPLLRSGLKEKIDNIVYITATPNQQSEKSVKSRSKFMNDVLMSTPRNLFHDFREDDDDDRPCTPENFICIIPESMSAIKRSHKKERSRKTERNISHLANTSESNGNLLANTGHSSTPQMNRKFASSSNRHSNKDQSWDESIDNSECSDNEFISDFVETKEKLSNLFNEPKSFQKSKCAPECESIKSENEIVEALKREGKESVGNSSEIETETNGKYDGYSNERFDVNINGRSMTPESNIPEYNKVTPENYWNFSPQVLQGSIKKSHKKSKDNGKRKIYSSKLFTGSLEVEQEKSAEYASDHSGNTENPMLEEVVPSILATPKVNRAVTPERVNSSRLLLSQFNSVKKSHKKDKHNKILSGFLKRQEYFNRDIDLTKNNVPKEYSSDACGYRTSSDDLTNFDSAGERSGLSEIDAVSKLSPSKRKQLDASLDLSMTGYALSSALNTSNAFCTSELQDCDSSKEEFKIFTPLKRRRSIATSGVKEYLCLYQLPSGDVLEDAVADISSSRCLTPVASFRQLQDFSDHLENDRIKTADDDLASEGQLLNDSNDLTGRSTPRSMSITELFSNINSIKKSHQKNKRESSWISLNSIKSKLCLEDKDDGVLDDESRQIEDNTENCADANSSDASIGVELIVNEDLADTEAVTDNSNLTPPNCLKTKSYIKLLQQTSIKRSHKKARDQKKIIIDSHELSDDGSLFGDEEKLASIENENNDNRSDIHTHK